MSTADMQQTDRQTVAHAWYMIELSGGPSLQTRRNAAQWHAKKGKATDHRSIQCTRNMWHCTMQHYRHAAELPECQHFDTLLA